MSRQRRTYAIHGIGLDVVSDAPAVIDAMEHRLQGFHGGPDAAAAELRLEFLTAEPLEPPAGASRPVYDTPYGAVHYHPDADALWADLDGIRLRCEASAGVVRVHSEAFAGRGLYLATHPLATIGLMELLERRGRFSLHAACLAHEGRGVLLAGPTGSGKSTLTLALLRAGLGFVSDDLVFLEHDSGAVRVLGFPDAVGVTEETAARFGDELGGRLESAPADGFRKRLVRVEDAFGAVAVANCAPRALVFPEVVTDEPGSLLDLDPQDAWLRLVPDVLLTQPAGTQSHLRAISALLAQVRCYTLRSGTDLGYTAELAAELLRRPA